MLSCIIWGEQFDASQSGGLHEKQAVATWEPSQHLLEPVLGWPVSGPPGSILTSRQIFEAIVKVKDTLRPTVSQLICLGVESHLGSHDQIFLLV
jgi:hypothetical protein